MPFFDEFTRNLISSLPPEAQAIHKNMVGLIETVVQAALSRLNLVTREEFDVQAAVLVRTREKLDQLEARFNLLVASTTKPEDLKTENDTPDAPSVASVADANPTDS